MDTFSKSKRSEIMRRVKSQDTSPELKIRSLLHGMGFRFRLHRKDLPGNPDIVLPKYKSVVFVHGCFWHRHEGCKRAGEPTSRRAYWLPKFQKTVKRDADNQKKLSLMGWNVVVVWECEMKNQDKLSVLLQRKILKKPLSYESNPDEFSLAAERPVQYRSGPKN